MNEQVQLQTENETLKTQVQQLEIANKQLEATTKSLASNVEQLTNQIAQLQADKSDLRAQLKKKEDELTAMLRRVFGRKSERFVNHSQLQFEFASEAELDDMREGIEQAIEENRRQSAKSHNKPRRRSNSERFPESLPRQEQVFDLDEKDKEGLKRIGEDIVESAHYRRAEVYILRKIFPKYVREQTPSSGIIQAPRPPALISGDRYDVSFAAAVVANRLGYHLPIYRQEDMFAESKLYLSRSTLLNLQEAAARRLEPFAEWLADQVRLDCCIGSDDTSVRLLLPKQVPQASDKDPKNARVREVFTQALAEGLKSVNAKMWAYRGVSIPINVFDFTVSRHRDGPDLFLLENDYHGTLLGDCYGANTGIQMRSGGMIVHAACVTHARRKAEAALSNHRRHAEHLLSVFRLLYDIEDECRGKTAADRLAARQLRSAPIWTQLRSYLETQMGDILSGDKITEARNYILNQWSGLTAHLSDGRVPIDNNECEQLMKQVALGRKNWLHLGSLGSGYRTATLMTVVSSAVRNDLEVSAYLEDILHRLVSGSRDYASMRPDAWAQEHPEKIRAYRQQQRQDHNLRRDRGRLDRRLALLGPATTRPG